MITLKNITYLTIKESAEFLGVSIMTIRRWMDSGKLNPYKMSPRKVFIKQEDLEELLDPDTTYELSGDDELAPF